MISLPKTLVLVSCSCAAVGTLLLVLLKWEVERSTGLVLGPIICFWIATIFSFFWPTLRLAVAVLTSSAFFLYFAGVSIALALNAAPEWTPVVEAIAVLVFAYFGATLGRFLATNYRGKFKNA